MRRMQAQKEVLCIQDGSDLRFATRPGCTGLEVIGRNQTKSRTQGMHLHLTLAVTPTGLPLGVLRCGFGTPHKAQGGKSRRWIDGYRDIAQAAGKLTRGTRVIAVMDREADFWGLFDEQRRRGRVEILVRAKHNRRLRKRPDGKLFTQLGGGPADGYMNVEVAGLTGRPKSSRKQARPPPPSPSLNPNFVARTARQRQETYTTFLTSTAGRGRATWGRRWRWCPPKRLPGTQSRSGAGEPDHVGRLQRADAGDHGVSATRQPVGCPMKRGAHRCPDPICDYSVALAG